MLNSTPVLVFLRMFGPLLVLIAAYLYFFGQPGGHQAMLDDLIAPYLDQINGSLGGMMGSAKAYMAPIADAKFSSGRDMLGQTFSLSGGGFVRP